MNKSKHIGIVAAAALCVFALLGGISHAGVVGSSHDLSATGGSNFQFATEVVCVFCHTPHTGVSAVNESTIWNTSTNSYENTGGSGQLLLWNRALTNAASSGSITYSTYTSSTMDADTSTVRAYSLLCLSCHDGISAMNVLHNYPADDNPDDWAPFAPMDPLNGVDQIGDVCPGVNCDINIGERVPGSDTGVMLLSNDHPISFDYPSTDNGLVAANPSGYVGDTAVRLFPNPSTGLPTSVECSTCHDVHNYGSGAQQPFLVMSNANSALCLNCHIK